MIYLNSIGSTTIITSENYFFESKMLWFLITKINIIKSDFPTKIIDPDGNIILVNMFNYNSLKIFFFQKADIKLEDKKKIFINLINFILMKEREKNCRFETLKYF